MPTQRTFIAIEIPEIIQARIFELQTELKKMSVRISWTKPQNIHLTLKFLGDVDANKTESISRSLADAVSQTEPFTFDVRHVGSFPDLKRARVLWIGIQDRGHQLAELAKNIEAELIQFGFSRENRKFTPHLTLGRVKTQLSPAFLSTFKAINFDAGKVTVREIVLMKSDLKPSGAIYTPLKKIKLG